MVKFSKTLDVSLDDAFLDGYTRKFEVKQDSVLLKTEESEIKSESLFRRGEMALLIFLLTCLETLSMFCWFDIALMPDGKYFSFYVDMVINASSDIVFSIGSLFCDGLGEELNTV